MSGLDKTLLFVAILDTLFVVAMITLFCLFQDVPESLVLAVFGATFGECGCCSYIWKHKKEMQMHESSLSGSGYTDMSYDTMLDGGEKR